MSDIDKIKIDILRDSLKDVIDTIRALDRKISFLVSYNAIFLGFLVTVFFKYEQINKILPNTYEYFYYFLGLLGFIWVCVFIGIMMGIAPKNNPVEVFKSSKDKQFANNVFYVSTYEKKESLVLDELIANYNKVDSSRDIQKLLYKEIVKVSFIRDSKLKSVSYSVTASWILTFIFLLAVIGFYCAEIRISLVS